MKRKTVAILLLTLMCGALAACGSSGNFGDNSGQTESAASSGQEENLPEENESPAKEGQQEETAETQETGTEEDDNDILNSTVPVPEDGQPDVTTMTVDEWATYEFNRDYETIISDVTSYDHAFLRKFLDDHWNMYMTVGIPDIRTLSDEESIALLTAHHNMRVNAMQGVDTEEKRIYLWPEGKVPTVTEYTENTGYAYADAPGFQPYMLEQLISDGTEIKGAVILSAGGGHMYRSNIEEAYEVSLALNELGYQCFILNYRIDPFSDEESALDVARAVKIVRANAEKYGVDENHIAAAGFSYGGIVTSLAADIYYGDTNASTLVKDYVPDEIDAVSSDINVYLAIYSVTPDEITNENFPPSFFTYGDEDESLWDWGYRCFNLLRDKGVKVELHTFAGVPHGFGAGTHASGVVYENASTWPLLADVFMQDVYAEAEAAEAGTDEDAGNSEAQVDEAGEVQESE